MTDDPRVVLAGASGRGYEWRVEAGGTDENFSTMMFLCQGGKLLHGGGMACPKLHSGNVMNVYRARKGSFPYMIVARTAPHVDRVLATTDSGTDIELRLSELVDQFGLRFAAAVLPDGHGLQSIRAEAHGQVLETAKQRMPRRRPPGGSGWIPTESV